MRFVTNSISTKSKVPTLSDMFKAAQTKAALSKTASAQSVEKPATTAKGGDFGGKKAPPFGKGGKPVKKEEKEKGMEKEECMEASSAKPTKVASEDKKEGESSGQLDADKNPNNKPEVKEEKASSGKGESKKEGEGESSGQLDVEPLHQKGESTGEKPGDLDTEKTEKKEATAKDSVKKTAFKKSAELTKEEKDHLTAVWSVYWPKEYIDAFLARQ